VVDALYPIMILNGNAMTVIVDGGNEIMIETLFEVDIIYPILKYTDSHKKFGVVKIENY
jgi:hypothetical protein